MLVVAIILLRSLWGIVSIVMMVVAVLLSGLGFVGWTGFKLYGESGAALFVLMAVTVAHAVHIIEAVRTGLRRGMDRRQAAIHAVELNIWPVFLTSVTTAIGFLSLNFSEMPPFRVMGNIVAFGSMCAFVYAVTLLPAFLSLVPMRPGRGDEGESNLFDRFGRFVVSRHLTLLGSFAVVVVVLVAGISRIELNENHHELLDKSYEYRRSTDFISKNFGGLEPFEYSLSAGKADGVTDAEYLRKVDAFAEWFRAQPEVVHVFSIADIMKRLNKNLNGDKPKFYKVPDDSDLAAQYLLLYEFSLPVGLDLNNLIDVERSTTRLTVVLRSLTVDEKIGLDDRAQAWLRKNAPGMETGASGITIVGAYSIKRNITNMLIGTVIAMGIVSLLLIFVFRSLRFGLISLIPNFVPAAMAMGLWGYAVKGGRDRRVGRHRARLRHHRGRHDPLPDQISESPEGRAAAIRIRAIRVRHRGQGFADDDPRVRARLSGVRGIGDGEQPSARSAPGHNCRHRPAGGLPVPAAVADGARRHQGNHRADQGTAAARKRMSPAAQDRRKR